MKGYIVGYLEDWGNDLNPIIVGYYTNWSGALDVIKQLERTNLDYHQGLQSVHIVEIEVNKTYPIKNVMGNWINNYTNYVVHTVRDKTTIRSNKGRVFEIDLPETTKPPTPEPEPIPEPIPTSQPESIPEQVPDEQWTEVERKKTRSRPRSYQYKPRRGKRLSRPN